MSVHPLSGLAMWQDWQATVRAALPNFAASPIYVDQSMPEAEFQPIADYVMARNPVDTEGMTRDAVFGARVVSTTFGGVTRMWLDSNVEIDFLRRNMGLHPEVSRALLLADLKILDIGAGYGRLAASLSPLVGRYVCVDAVPVSTEVCRTYCSRFAPKVEVPSLPDFLAIYKFNYAEIDLAINIHSWNECTREQITAWLDVLAEIGIPYLFTVSHGQNDASIEQSYYAWEEGRPSWRPLIEARYELIAEESIGLTNHPHGLWKMKQY